MNEAKKLTRKCCFEPEGLLKEPCKELDSARQKGQQAAKARSLCRLHATEALLVTLFGKGCSHPTERAQDGFTTVGVGELAIEAKGLERSHVPVLDFTIS